MSPSFGAADFRIRKPYSPLQENFIGERQIHSPGMKLPTKLTRPERITPNSESWRSTRSSYNVGPQKVLVFVHEEALAKPTPLIRIVIRSVRKYLRSWKM
jgi:hypothetical protein